MEVELLDFMSYYKIVNPQDEEHDENAYPTDLNKLNEFNKIENFNILINQFKKNGISFELREKITDKCDYEYVRRDSSGNIIYENGNVTYLNKKEKELRFKENRYTKEHAIIDKTNNKIVGTTTDENGALLIRVASEYKGFGLGERLLSYQRKTNPYRQSGGFTPQGFKCFHKHYQNKVKNFLISGGYSKAVRSGLLTHGKVRKILDSAMISQKTVKNNNMERYEFSYLREREQKLKNSEINLNLNSNEDWLIKADQNSAYIYNKKFYEILNYKGNIDKEFFLDKTLIGYSYIGGVLSSYETPIIYRTYGINKNIEEKMIEIALNLDPNEYVQIMKEDYNLLSDKLKAHIIVKESNDEMHTIKLKQPTIKNLRTLSFLEKKFRKLHDTYDDKLDNLQERFYEKTEFKYKNKENNKSYRIKNI